MFSGDTNYTGSSSSQTGNFAITQAGSGSITVSSSAESVERRIRGNIHGLDPGQYNQVKGRNGKKPMTVTGTVAWTSNGVTIAGCDSTSVTSGNPGDGKLYHVRASQLGATRLQRTTRGDSNHNSGSRDR